MQCICLDEDNDDDGNSVHVWYYEKGDEKQGPVSIRELRKLLNSGRLKPADHVWKAGEGAKAVIHVLDAKGI